MENNQSHKSGVNITLYNVSMMVFPLLLHISIWTCPVFFVVKKFLSAISIYLSISANESGIKSEISGTMWQAAPEY